MKIIHRKTLHMGVIAAVLAVPIAGYALLRGDSTVKADAINTTDFVITVKTDNTGVSNPNQFTIPTNGSGYNYTVDCDNDGVPELTGNTGTATCTYGAPGTHTIRIGGTFPRIYFNDGGDKLKILSVDQWGTGTWDSMVNAFYGAENMDVKATDTPKFATGVPFDAQNMFRNNKSLVGSGANWNWNVSQLRFASSMFNGAEKFNQNIGGWNVSNVTRMGNMFAGNKEFNNGGSDSIKNWDTSKVEFMDSVFAGATSFNQPIGSWNTSAVIGMKSMFAGATSFNQPLTNFNIAALRTTGSAYVGAANMLDGTALSIANYDATIKAWSTQNVATGLTIGAAGLKYCQAEPEHTLLVNTKNVNFVGDGKDCSNFQPTAVTLSGSTAIVENTAVDSELGSLATTAPAHASGGYTYSLCGGAQDVYVTVDGDKLKLAQSPDFETIQNLAVCVRTTNKLGQTFDQTLNFTVTNLFTLTYDTNGATSGTVPAASETYAPGVNATVAGNTGNLAKTNFVFDGWATQPNGGTILAPGSIVAMNSDTTLYARWRDNVAPVTPAAAPDMTAATDSGDSDSDNVTNNKSPEFVATCTEVGSTIKLYLDGVEAKSVNCTAPGPVTVQLSNLADKDYTLTYTETDASGNESQRSPVLNFTIDTTPPAQPQITIESITGDDTINQTEATRPQLISGTITGAKDDDQVTLMINDHPRHVSLHGNRFTFVVPGADLAANPERKVAVSITVKDIAGNTATASQERPYNVDTAPAPTPAAPTLKPDSDTGRSNSDGITNDTTPTVILTCQNAADKLRIFINGFPFQDVQCTQAGPMEVTLNTLGQGIRRVTYTVENAVGNVSAPSVELPLKIDTTAPQADIQTSGTFTATPNITGGTNDTDAIVIVAINGVDYPAINAAGTWTVPASALAALASGLHNFTVKVTDIAGNVTTIHGSFTLNLPMPPTPPTPPVAPTTPTMPTQPTVPQKASGLAGTGASLWIVIVVAIGMIAGGVVIIHKKFVKN